MCRLYCDGQRQIQRQKLANEVNCGVVDIREFRLKAPFNSY